MAMWVMAVVGEAPCQCFSPGGEPDDIAGMNLCDGAAEALGAAAAGGDDDGLAEGMGVPGGAGTGLEGDGGGCDAGGGLGLDEGIDAHGAGEPGCGAMGRGA